MTVEPKDIDGDIAAQLRQGEATAIGRLYDRYGRLAYGLALRVLNDRTAAEDVVQEAFLGSGETPSRSIRRGVRSATGFSPLFTIAPSTASGERPGSARRRGSRPSSALPKYRTPGKRFPSSWSVSRSRRLSRSFPTPSGARSSSRTSAAAPTWRSPVGWTYRWGP